MVTLKPYKTPMTGMPFASKTHYYGPKHYTHHANNTPNNAEEKGGESPTQKSHTFNYP